VGEVFQLVRGDATTRSRFMNSLSQFLGGFVTIDFGQQGF
jgi:hypothetical protein